MSKRKLLIKNAQLVLENEIVPQASLYCEDGKIVSVGKDIPVSDDCETIDAEGNFLAPGFIDLHIHGTLGKDLNNGPEELVDICNLLPRFGVTGFCPTFEPRKPGEDADYIAKISKVVSRATQILALHIEGPFLTLTGALPPESLGAADTQRVINVAQAALPYKLIFSVAPDFEGLDTLLPVMRDQNCIMFMTHTKANVEQTLKAIESGVCHATHFYDVFPTPPVTDPGVRPSGAVEAVLASPQVSVDFILDGEHVDPIAVKMVLACKGPDKVCLITDASPGAGSEPGKRMFCGQEVEIKYPGGPARQTGSGGLAGSGLTMDLAVKNAVKLLDASLPQAVKMASANPARVLGLENAKGKIEENFDADFVILDSELKVKKTFVDGVCCYDDNVA